MVIQPNVVIQEQQRIVSPYVQQVVESPVPEVVVRTIFSPVRNRF
jgi:hypothetical protein